MMLRLRPFQALAEFVMRASHPRSAAWPRVRDEHLAKFPTCAASGSTRKLQVHHIRPYHLFPHLELDPSNLITLSERSDIDRINFHFLVGHLGDWKAYNPDVVRDAALWLHKIQHRPYG